MINANSHAHQTLALKLAPGLFAERQGGVLFLCFEDAASRNAVRLDIARALAAFVEPAAFSRHADVGALALVSRVPGVFISGGDLHALAAASDAQGDEITRCMRAFCEALGTLSVPTFALLSGAAYGGGSEIALACDFRVTEPGAALHLWQTKWAVPGGWHGMARLEELCPGLGTRRTSLLFAAARSLDAAMLERLGLAEFPLRANATAEPCCASQEAIRVVEEFAEGFLSCPKDLRDGLLERSRTGSLHASALELRKRDEALFARHWLGPEHRRRLVSFASRKSPQ